MSNRIAQIANKNCQCKKQGNTQKYRSAPLLLSIIIAVLPKCPFCIFGYSSVLVLCSGTPAGPQNPLFFQLVPPLVVAGVALSLWWNYKDRRTWVALAMTVLGGAIVWQAQQRTGDLYLYYAGAGLIFVAVFVNGPFLYFWNRLIRLFSHNR